MKKIVSIVGLFLLLLVAGFLWAQTTPQLKRILTNKPPLITKRYFGVTIAGPEFQTPFYTNASYTGYQYFHDKGLTLVRIPFQWERLQPILSGPLDTNQLQQYTQMVISAQRAGEKVLIEPHNFARYNNTPLTTADHTSFSDLWGKIASTFKNVPGVWGYELMNEPHDLQGGCQTWQTLSQSAIDAIRQQDTTHYILVPGYNWQSAVDWQTSSDCLKNLHDPANKLIYSAHEYFDADKSGTYTSACTDTNIGVTRAQPFLSWLKTHNAIGMFTEYGIPPTACWETTLDKFMQDIYHNPNIIGGLYWAAGPAWGNYPLSVEPQNNQDKPQMKILSKYPSTK